MDEENRNTTTAPMHHILCVLVLYICQLGRRLAAAQPAAQAVYVCVVVVDLRT
jgi:hypothetical protein